MVTQTHNQEIIESQKRIINSLRNEVRWYKGLISNPVLDEVDMRLLANNVPEEVKMGLVVEVPERKVFLPELGKQAHTSAKTASRHLRVLAKETGAFSYRTEKDEKTGNDRVLLAPLPPSRTPDALDRARAQRGGSIWEDGKRIKRCKDCGSANLVKASQIVCGDCGASQGEKTYKPVNDTHSQYDRESQADDDSREEATDPDSHIDTDPSEVEAPDSHIDCEPSNDEISNCPPITNPITGTQNDVTNSDSGADSHIDSGGRNDWTATLTTWLEKRIGHGRIIRATGKLEQNMKYFYQPEGYTPDIAAYLAGKLPHIYGSRPAWPDGTTYLLGFDCDTPELDSQHRAWQAQLAEAGIPSVYWNRRLGRGHLEIYTNQAVDRKAFYAWVISVCPGLAAIPEAFPVGSDQNTGGVDRSNFGYSWPLYQRIGDRVTECSVEAMSPARLDKVYECKGVQSDPERLAQIVTRCVTKASLVPPLPVKECSTQQAQGGGLLDKKAAYVFSYYEVDLTDDFNRSHSWDEVASWCGGWSKTGHFKAVWRGERTASVKPDRDGRKAHDYGKTGNFPADLDQYEIYCLVNGLDKHADLNERRAAMRQGVAA